MRLCTYWTCTSYNHGLAQTIHFIFLGKAQTVSCQSFFISGYKSNYRDSVDNLALELTAVFEGGLCSFQIVFILQQVMYLPTMPEDNLLEAMTTIRDAKFYGKLTSSVVTEVNGQNISQYVTHESSLLLVCSMSQRPSLCNWRCKYYIYVPLYGNIYSMPVIIHVRRCLWQYIMFRMEHYNMKHYIKCTHWLYPSAPALLLKPRARHVELPLAD